MKIYLAGSIFYYGDVLRNTEWAKKIREAIPGVDLYSPLENSDINGPEGKKKFAGSKEIADGDNARLDNTDILVVCIDGDVIPAGSAAETGVMREKIRRGDHKYIVGICTDNRQMFLTHSKAKNEGGAAALGEQQYSYQNLYVTGLIKESGILVSNIDDAIAFLKQVAPEFKSVTDTIVTQDRPRGWICPKCGNVYSPDVTYCWKCNNLWTITTTTTPDIMLYNTVQSQDINTNVLQGENNGK